MTPSLRRASTLDWTAIAGLCADTGRQGEPVDAEEREAFAEHWIGPYRELRPDWTWVAVFDKKVVGYLTGCPDTLSFEKERRRLLNPQGKRPCVPRTAPRRDRRSRALRALLTCAIPRRKPGSVRRLRRSRESRRRCSYGDAPGARSTA